MEQNGSESFASGTAETPGQGGFAEISVNKQYFFAGIGESCGQIGGGEGFPFSGEGRGNQNDVSSLFRSGEHGIYVIAQDVEAFRDDGMFVLNEKTGISTFFFVHLGQFGNDRLPVCGREIVFIVNLVVQHGRSHEGKYAEQGTSRRSSRDVLNGFWGNGKVGPMGGFQNPGAGFRYRHSQGVFLFLA